MKRRSPSRPSAGTRDVTRQEAPIDDIFEHDLAPCIRRFRAFLGQQNIDTAARQLAERDAQGNPFRSGIIREKQIWIDAFENFDRLTLNGVRPLRARSLSIALFRAAAAGKALERVEPTLPAALKEHMRARLLDLDGRSEPVMMEWDFAHFYLRHGFRVVWTDQGISGPEFRCSQGVLGFEVECKRVTRSAKEVLGDKDATSLAHAVMKALAAHGLCGELILDTPILRSPAEKEVIVRVRDTVPTPAPLRLDVDIPNVGRITGDVRPIPAQARANIRQHVDFRIAERPHDHWGFGITVPLNARHALDSIVLWLRGPRRTQAEHLAHIGSRVTEAAEQLSGDVPGVVAIEMEGIADAGLFKDKAPFREMNARAFHDYPYLAAVVWRCDLDFVPVPNGFSPSHQTFVERNSACVFADATQIPFLDSRN